MVSLLRTSTLVNHFLWVWIRWLGLGPIINPFRTSFLEFFGVI